MWFDDRTTPLLAPSRSNIGTLLLGLAILFEVAGTTLMKVSIDHGRVWTVPAYVMYALSFSMFPYVLESVPLNVAYLCWSGMGSLCVSLVSLVVFEESYTWAQIVGFAFVFVGMVMVYAV